MIRSDALERLKPERFSLQCDVPSFPVFTVQLIDEYIFGVPGTDEWKGTCSDLLSRLMKSAANPNRVEILHYQEYWRGP